jgi:Leucine-rich repeat (LRR) protein
MLSLSNNKHFTLPEGGSFLSSKSLRVLHLSACNLPHIPPETFRQLPNLQQLDISHNQIITLNTLKGVTLLATLDMSYNYLRDLQLSFFLALPNLSNLNLSFNNLSTLTVNVTAQLANVCNTGDLQGNPWVCDCLMYRTMYCWCRNNRVNWSLVCSSPSRFEGKLWTIYEQEGCDDDHHHHHTDVEYQVENFTMINGNLSPNASHANYSILPPSGVAPTKFQEGNTQRYSVYFYTTICLGVLLLLVLLAILILLCKTYLTSRRSKRAGPAESDVEMCRLTGDNG